MFILWGTKETKKRLGFVADFCLTCGKIGTFEVHKHALKSHLYYLPYGKEKEVQYRKCCQECSNIFGADVNTYSSILNLKKMNLSSDDLISKTFININDVYKDRLELENNIKNGPKAVGVENWKYLLREPFEISEEKLNNFSSQTQLDFMTLIFIGVVLILPVITAKALELTTIDIELKTYFIIASFAIGVVLAFVQYLGVKKRYVLSTLYPDLARSLSKFKKYEPDIEKTFEALKLEGFKVVKKGNYKDLVNLIWSN